MTTSQPPYPWPALTALTTSPGKPTAASMLLCHQQLNENAMSQPSMRRGAIKGHLGLVTSQADYFAASNHIIPYVPPIHPGPTPAPTATMTAPVLQEANRVYKAAIKAFEIHQATEAALKAQFLAVIPPCYLEDLKHIQFGFANVTVLDMITHIDTTYGTITNKDRLDNRTLMQKSWDPTAPIEDLWIQMNRGQQFARTGRDPISDMVMVEFARANIKGTGLFTEPLACWDRQPDQAQTFATFKKFFNTATTERINNTTAAEAGYMAKEKAESEHVALLKEQLATYKALLAAQAGQAPVQPGGANQPGRAFEFYCHTHGGSSNTEHTSASCNNPGPNHKADATSTNSKCGHPRTHRGGGNRGGRNRGGRGRGGRGGDE